MDIQKTYVQMFQTLEAIEREREMIPNGWIEPKGEADKCYRYYENGRKCSSTPDNIDELEKLFEKRKHLLQEKKILRVKMKSCREQLKKQGLSPTLIIRKYKREKKQHNGKTYYWGHNGMMDKKKYRDAWHWRRDLYEANGIYEFVNMIITSETEKSPLTQEMIDKVISTYFTETS